MESVMNVLRNGWSGRRDAPSRTPSIRQVQETECGVAALAIVLAHYGAWVPFPELRRLCEVSDQGVTALSIVQAAKHYGLALRGMRLGVDALQHLPAPLILSWERWHFVVLEGVRGEVAWINDPARGHRRVSLAELRKSYSGIALIAKPGPDFTRIGEPRQPLRAAATMLRPAAGSLALLATASLVEAVLLPTAVSRAGSVISGRRTSTTGGWRPLALTLGGLLAVSAARRWSGTRMEEEISTATATPGNPSDEMRQAVTHAAATSAGIVTAGTRMAVSVPLLLRILARLHPAVALITMPALAAPLLTRPPIGEGTFRLSARQRSRARLIVMAMPALVAGTLSTEDVVPTAMVAFGASWVAFRLVDSAADAIGMLYLLPESIIEITSGHAGELQISDVS